MEINKEDLDKATPPHFSHGKDQRASHQSLLRFEPGTFGLQNQHLHHSRHGAPQQKQRSSFNLNQRLAFHLHKNHF